MRADDTLRPLAWKKLSAHHVQLTGPLPWKKDPSSRIRVHLPIDSLAHLAIPFIPSTGNLPARLTHLLPSDTPQPASGLVTWPAIKSRLRAALGEDWEASAPRPGYYQFSLSLAPHAFMVLPKFLAGRLHQMRAGKSYLAAHRQSWREDSVSPVSPRCSSEDETFKHAFLSCPPRAWAKARFLPMVTSLGQDSPIWTSPTLLVAMAKYIKATATGFPDNMPPLGTGSPTRDSIDDAPAWSTFLGSDQPHTVPTALTAAFAAGWGAVI